MQVPDYQAILKIVEKRHISHISSEEHVGEFFASFERDKHENFWKLEGVERGSGEFHAEQASKGRAATAIVN